ncbi:ras-related GTP-binding protein-like protein A [Eremomyces bilateralis CBS 781.70]|uniref:GTP-binding protein n=1 Tax=Eremomyces bilateralis CBS 781.70 TaxID=1392243 RepID=A0A6G1G849_9PEZI|nr:ras-related GTP-binding protein-like protein A [Eremomyces bilateralis CBS 781.70]KAF1814070.1 ras-related GTP-binding protein-like protein A [Eremomyces bilateralis CBS 781.70]
MASQYPKRLKQRKVLLMGKSGAGKSSMRSIVFSNYVATDVRRLGATIDVEHSNIKFMGNLTLNLWDCGGQDGFVENYLTHQREHVFGSVAIMIFVFDIESPEFQADVINYSNIIHALQEWSPTAKVFCLIHKMDLVQNQLRGRLFDERSQVIRDHSEVFGKTIEFFATSIWDQSLYRAWTQIIYHLIPNASEIERMLQNLAELIDARELVLYERTTCLVVAKVTRGLEKQNPFKDRFERLSSILKNHKQSMAKHTGVPAGSANFAELQIKTGRFMFFITQLTENTNLAVDLPPSEQMFNSARINIQLVRHKFEELDVGVKRLLPQPQSPQASMQKHAGPSGTAGQTDDDDGDEPSEGSGEGLGERSAQEAEQSDDQVQTAGA